MVAETGREVPAEQARADRLRVPGAGGLGVCSPPSWARSDAALQTLGAELLALAALRGRAPDCSRLALPSHSYYWKCKIRLLTLCALSPPKKSFSGYIQETLLRLSALTNLCIVTFSKQVKTELLVNSSCAETGWQLTLPVGTTAIKVGRK